MFSEVSVRLPTGRRVGPVLVLPGDGGMVHPVQILLGEGTPVLVLPGGGVTMTRPSKRGR